MAPAGTAKGKKGAAAGKPKRSSLNDSPGGPAIGSPAVVRVVLEVCVAGDFVAIDAAEGDLADDRVAAVGEESIESSPPETKILRKPYIRYALPQGHDPTTTPPLEESSGWTVTKIRTGPKSASQLWKWEKRHSLISKTAKTESEVAVALDDDPHAVFVLGDAGDPSGGAAEAPILPRSCLSVIPLDISGLLEIGRTCGVGLERGLRPLEWTPDEAPLNDSQNHRTSKSRGVGGAGLPIGLSYLRIWVGGDASVKGKNETGETATAALSGATVFPSSVLEPLNPLCIRPVKLTGLPSCKVSSCGVRIVGAPFAALGSRRQLCTTRKEHESKMCLDATGSSCCILASRVDNEALRAFFDMSYFSLEVHDNDEADEPHETVWKRHAESLVVHPEGSRGSQSAVDPHKVDQLVLRHFLESALKSGETNAHGLVKFRVGGALDPAVRKFGPLLLEEAVIPAKRRSVVSLDEELRVLDMPTDQRKSRLPRDYLGAQCRLTLEIKLANPSALREQITTRTPNPSPVGAGRFCRGVISFEYSDINLLQSIDGIMSRLNWKGLDAAQVNVPGGSLQSYQLEESEVKKAKEGKLDIICGFSIIDCDCRMVVLEGLAEGVSGEDGEEESGALVLFFKELGRRERNSGGYRVLFDPTVRFTHGLYSNFGVDLKRIRLRSTLSELCSSPDLYDRKKVPQISFDVLLKLRSLRSSDRIRSAAKESLFPCEEGLLRVEASYGETISLEDMHGTVARRRHSRRASSFSQAGRDGLILASLAGAEEAEHDAEPGSDKLDPEAIQRRKAPTDSRNAAFEHHLLQRSASAPHSYVEERRQEAARIKEMVSTRRKIEQRLLDEESASLGTIYTYSIQSLNDTERRKAELRKRLMRDIANATFTYSKDFVSQTVPLVDPDSREEKTSSKKKWKTARGFVWPAPRTREELIRHPQRPSDSRICILKEPWVENELHPEKLPRDGNGEGPLPGMPDFNTVPSNGRMIFGSLGEPKYERGMDFSCIGSRSKLPRGRAIVRQVPLAEYFRSVHLCGEGLYEERLMEQERAKAEWKSKLVVDDVNFYVGGFAGTSSHRRTLQLDRYRDILTDKPMKASIRLVRNVTLPSGRRVEFPRPPVSLSILEPWIDPLSVRDPKSSVSSLDNGSKQPFTVRCKPKKGILIGGGKKIARMGPEEKRGPLWTTVR